MNEAVFIHQKRIGLFLAIFFLFILFSPPLAAKAEHEGTHLRDVRDIQSGNLMPGPETIHEDPHGSFKSNTNACSQCHSVHRGKASKLMKESTQEKTCYLCHDGRGSKYDAKNGKFFNETTGVVVDSAAGGFSGSTSSHNIEQSNPAQGGKETHIQLVCTSCHNPHGSTNHRNLQTTVNGRLAVDVKASVTLSSFSNKEVVSYESGMTNFCTSCHEDYSTYYQENAVNDNRHYRHPVETPLTGGKAREVGPTVPQGVTFSPTLFTTLPTQGVPSGAYPSPETSVVTTTSVSAVPSTGGSLGSGDYQYFVMKTSASDKEVVVGMKRVSGVAENAKVTLSWTAAAAEDTFHIYRSKKYSATEYSPWSKVGTVNNTNTFTDNGLRISYQNTSKGTTGLLTPEKTYLYIIQAKVNGIITNESILPPVILASTEKSISLSWDMVANATHYYIYRANPDSIKPQDRNFKLLAKITTKDAQGNAIPNTNSMIDNGLIPLKPVLESLPQAIDGTLTAGNYFYIVTGVNSLGESHQGYVKKVNVPSTGNNSSIALQWDAITNAANYNVYRAKILSGEPVLTDFKLISSSTADPARFSYRENASEGYFIFTDTNLAAGTQTPPEINSQKDSLSQDISAKVTCITCHFAHGTQKTDSHTGDSRLKRIDNSGVCQDCHKK